MNRFLETVLILLISPIWLPLWPLVWLTVRLSLGTPVFFVQARSGRGGKVFDIVKFRSMSDARDASGALLPDDRRVTRAGRVLRLLRLDELPQLWSILRGDMALVGPRPLLPGTLRSFGTAGFVRGSVRPGLTGWAQVSGNTALTDREKLELDLWYVAHRSTLLDLRILAETVAVVIFRERRKPARIALAADWAAGMARTPTADCT